jgi:hypothetical protein
MDSLTVPSSTDMKTFWSRPEGKMALIIYAAIIGGVVWFWGLIVPFLLNLLVDTLHMVYLAGLLGAILYLVFGKRPRLMFRVLVRKFTSLFVAVYPIEIIEDKLLQMKKRREKMNEQIGLVNGSIQKLQRKISDNESEAKKRFGMATQAQKMAGQTQDAEEQFRMQMAMKKQANAAQRRQNANIGYAKLLERIQKVYKFLTHYATNVDYFIDDTQDEIDQKKVEYETTMAASGAMKQAMAVIKGSATEEDIYDQAFDFIENSVSTQLGIMDDLQRVSQNFMDGMDIENGAVDDSALQALNAFEQKALTAGNTDFKMVTGDKAQKAVPVPATKWPVTNDDYQNLLK